MTLRSYRLLSKPQIIVSEDLSSRLEDIVKDKNE